MNLFFSRRKILFLNIDNLFQSSLNSDFSRWRIFPPYGHRCRDFHSLHQNWVKDITASLKSRKCLSSSSLIAWINSVELKIYTASKKLFSKIYLFHLCGCLTLLLPDVFPKSSFIHKCDKVTVIYRFNKLLLTFSKNF